MQRKIKAVGGTVDFRSSAGHGFEVFLRIPLGAALTKTHGVDAHLALTKNVHMLAADIGRIANSIKERTQAIVK